MTGKTTAYRTIRTSRRRLLAGVGTAGVGTAALALVGCGSDSESSTTPTTARGSATAPSSSPSAAATAAPKKGGRLKLGAAAPLLNANPPYSINSVNTLTGAIWDTLFSFKDTKLTPGPRLASAFEFNGDKSEITVTLKPNLTFHSGKAIDAQAVVDSFNSLSAKTTPTSQVRGVATAYVQSAAAVDPSHVKFVLKKPGDLVFDMFNYWNIADAANIDALSKGGLPNGSGPFKVISNTPQQGAKLDAFAGYWNPALLDGIDYMIYPSESSLVLAQKSGTMDIAFGINANDAKALANQYKVIATSGFDAFFTVRFNVKGEAIGDKRVRQAIFHAIDRGRATDGVFLGYATPAVSIWPPTSAAFDPKYKNDPLDVARAKQLLTAAGFASGTPEIEMLCNSDDDGSKALFEFYQADLARVGIDFKLNPKPRAAATKEFISGAYPGGDAGLMGFTWMHPATGIFMSQQLTIPNSSNFDTPEYEAFQKQIGAADTDDQRQAAYTAFNQIWDDELWTFPICNNPSLYAVSKKVAGFNVDAFGNPEYEAASFA